MMLRSGVIFARHDFAYDMLHAQVLEEVLEQDPTNMGALRNKALACRRQVLVIFIVILIVIFIVMVIVLVTATKHSRAADRVISDKRSKLTIGSRRWRQPLCARS